MTINSNDRAIYQRISRIFFNFQDLYMKCNYKIRNWFSSAITSNVETLDLYEKTEINVPGSGKSLFR